ncbi:protein of unknown function [Rhodovastum atsumiense]|nr:protein of unknown function [Rhodovastum atsumiense]
MARSQGRHPFTVTPREVKRGLVLQAASVDPGLIFSAMVLQDCHIPADIGGTTRTLLGVECRRWIIVLTVS